MKDLILVLRRMAFQYWPPTFSSLLHPPVLPKTSSVPVRTGTQNHVHLSVTNMCQHYPRYIAGCHRDIQQVSLSPD